MKATRAAALVILQIVTLSPMAHARTHVAIERGQHYTRWARVDYQTNADGSVTTTTNSSFVQLSTGLNRWNGAAWMPSNPRLLVTTNGVIGYGAGHSAFFAGNLNTSAAVQIQNDGQWLKLNFIGLAYQDVSTGTNILIAQVKDSAPYVAGNTVRYTNATTGFRCTVAYEYSAAGVRQNIIIREPPPDPANLGLNPATTHLLVISEIVDGAEPSITERSWPSGPDTMHDQNLHFGGMSMLRGQAFEVGNNPSHRRTAVAKQYQVIGQRRFEIERVRYQEIKHELRRIQPPGPDDSQSGQASTGGAQGPSSAKPFVLANLPKLPKVGKPVSGRIGETAAITETSGFVLDWDYVYDGYDFYFYCWDTYVVSGETHLTSAYVEPLTVIKEDLGSSLYVDGALTCGDTSDCGSGYATITSINDTSYGEDIGWYPEDGSPAYGDYGPGLVVYPQYLSAAQAHIQDLYGDPGIISQDPPPPTITVAVGDAVATKGTSDTATLTVSRVNGDWSQPLTVQLAVSGTAVSGVDYQAVNPSVMFGASQGSTNVTVVPASISGSLPESTVVLSVKPSTNSSYLVGTPDTAMAYIDDPSASFPLSVAVPSGLVGWWRAETNGWDSASTNNGALTGVTYTNGMVANGFYFQGTNRLNVSDSPILDFNTNVDFTAECWIQPKNVSSTYGLQAVLGKRFANCCNSVGWELILWNGQLLCTLADAPLRGSWNYGPGGPDLRDGRFHHIALTMQRTSTTGGLIYIDGTVVLVFDPTGQHGDLTTTDPLRIGCHPNTNLNANFTGTIDEVSIYNRALTTNEVVSIFSANRAGKYIDSDSNGLLDAWELRYFGHTGVDPNADADSDGLSNLQEYVLGINPTRAAQTDTNNVANLQVYTPLK